MAKAMAYGRTRRGNPERVLELAIAARACGMISGVFSLLVFLLLLVACAPHLELNSNDLLEDVNLATWRARFFTFNPRVFGNLWTPSVMGTISLCIHFRRVKCRWLTKSWGRFGLWHFVQGMFGNLGYCGGMGFIAAAWSFLAALFGFCVYFLHPRIPVSWGIDCSDYMPRDLLSRTAAGGTGAAGEAGGRVALKSVVTRGDETEDSKGGSRSRTERGGRRVALELRRKKENAEEMGDKTRPGTPVAAEAVPVGADGVVLQGEETEQSTQAQDNGTENVRAGKVL